jgi:hypothetical protein
MTTYRELLIIHCKLFIDIINCQLKKDKGKTCEAVRAGRNSNNNLRTRCTNKSQGYGQFIMKHIFIILVAVIGFGFSVNAQIPDIEMVNCGKFSIGKYEVTKAQWKSVMGSVPDDYCPNCPVSRISWDDVQVFIKKLNEKTGKNYRLPTEREWEYAANGGKSFYQYSGSNDIDAVAWWNNNAGSIAHEVGQKQPNGYGIYDMTGNVAEWVQDWYTRNVPPNTYRVVKGGSFYSYKDCTITSKGFYMHSSAEKKIGFRLIYDNIKNKEEQK